MKNKIIFKTLMLKGEAGSTIVSMEKTGHVGTADIYTITFNDGSTTEISLENMSAITSVEKTSSTDTEDIYTITCADGSTQTFSVLNHNADIAAMSDDIDTIDARVDNFINSVVPNTVETLWTGSIKDVGDSATLSKAVSNFDYIDLYLLGSADSKYIRVPATQTAVDIQQQNLSDDASSNFLRLWEMGVSISGSTVSITKLIAWAWDDPNNSNPTVTANAQNGVPITRIDGVKVASDTPAEVTDIRVGADGTTYNSAGAAVRGQISDLKNTLNVIPHTFIDQAIAQKTLVFGNKGTDTTDHNRLSFSTTIYIKHGTQLKAKAGYQFGAYSRKKAVVTAFTTTYTAPVDRWLWIVFKKTDNSDFDSTDLNVMDLLDLNDYSAFYNMGESDSVLTPITNFDWYNVQYGTDTATTMLFKEATNRISTSYYPDIPIYNVNIGDRVKIKLVNSGYKFKYAIAAIDDNADIVPLYPTTWNVYDTNDIDFISSYHGALAVVLAHSDDSNISTSESNNISVEIIPKNYDLLKNKKWYGKTATFMGDSITAGVNTSDGYIYYQMLAVECGFIATGMGVGGSCYSVTSDYGTLHDPISTRYTNIPDSDLICLFAGTNDYGHDTPMGTIADTTDISFYGALRVVIGGLIAMYPNRRLVVMTPLHRYNFGGLVYDTDPNGAGNTLEDYVNAIKNVCKLYGVPVIDTFSISGLNPMVNEIYQNYVTDGLHPNAAGHKLIAERVMAYFEAL